MIVDGDVGILITRAGDDLSAVPVNAMADAQNPGERFDIECTGSLGTLIRAPGGKETRLVWVGGRPAVVARV